MAEDTADTKVWENRLRRKAARQGLMLQKSRLCYSSASMYSKVD